MTGAIKKINPIKKQFIAFCVPVVTIHLAQLGHGD
jgi:hypothetical protein